MSLKDKDHPIWRLLTLVVVLFGFQLMTASNYDLDGEGVALGGTAVLYHLVDRYLTRG